ncbi:MAG: tetratricopeptide repeat protein, partial [Saprospiraceae bacterium]
FSLTIMTWACTPKVVEETVTEVKEDVPPPPPSNSKCPTFADSGNEDAILEKYVILQDEMGKQSYETAKPLWDEVYGVAPAADGKRTTIYFWGVELYDYMYQNETDAAKKKEYAKKIIALYDEMVECYPDKKAYSLAMKGFDLYYNYPDEATDKEKYNTFKQVVDAQGNSTPSFALSPFADLIVSQFDAKVIQMSEAQKYVTKVNGIIQHGLQTSRGEAAEEYRAAKDYAEIQFESFEWTKGFYGCEYYKGKAMAEFNANPTDCDVINESYSRLLWGDCPKTDADVIKVIAAYNKNCREEIVTTPTGTPEPKGPNCYDLNREGKTQEAIDCFKERYNSASDADRKARYALAIAQIYFRNLKSYSKSREWSNKALESKPGWGKAYMNIGSLYASSGRACGPGTGWDSQVVIWPAMDMWQKAKKDPQTRADAQKMINRYSQYLPDAEQAFMKGNVKHGQSYKVGCWIQRTTTARIKGK